MVLTEACAGAVGAHSLFNYNRSNYMFDKEMRQKQEFKLWDFRMIQAELWRDDVREILGLTERKMENYLVVCELQVAMCIGLFCEGRLEPGTPAWILHLYMLALGGAFMYLLMATWLAVHATVVAQCSSVRLLTQFVRLPVPTFEDIEDIRTYGVSYESMSVGRMLRVPFFGRADGGLAPPSAQAAAGVPSSSKSPPSSSTGAVDPWRTERGLTPTSAQATTGGQSSSKTSPTASMGTVDPWHTEPDSATRNIYELQQMPARVRRHIGLARRAATQYQCYDAFARVSMTFGTNQLLHAVSCFCLGYVGVQDGVSWPALVVVAVTCGMALMLAALDFSLSRRQQLTSQALIAISFVLKGIATTAWIKHGEQSLPWLKLLLPLAFCSHGLWLVWAMVACEIRETASGALLPQKFRAVLYLDVFGWPSGRRHEREQADVEEGHTSSTVPNPEYTAPTKAAGVDGRSEVPQEDRRQARAAASGSSRPSGPAGEIHEPPHHAFRPESWVQHHHPAHDSRIVTGHTAENPGTLPAKLFRSATMLLSVLWASGAIVSLSGFGDVVAGSSMIDEIIGDLPVSQDELKRKISASVGADAFGMPELVPESGDHSKLPPIGEGEIVDVRWPSRSAFVPRAVAGDASGTRFVVTDDFAVYVGRLVEATGGGPPTLEFKKTTTCRALDGQGLEDIDMVCGEGSRSRCNVLALHLRGTRISMCQVQGLGSTSEKVVKPTPSAWNISTGWLHDFEDTAEVVDTFAANKACLSEGSGSMVALPEACVVVGTSAGRIVQLKGSSIDSHRLVPQRIMHQHPHPSTKGSLAFIASRYLVSLWHHSRSISAFDSATGSTVGEWQLPMHIQWVTLAGCGDRLFVLGVDPEGHVVFYRFAVLQKFSARRDQEMPAKRIKD